MSGPGMVRYELLEIEKRQEKLEDDLYFAKYMDSGCGGPNHEFSGDPSDRLVLLYCQKCGIPKKYNASLPGKNVA